MKNRVEVIGGRYAVGMALVAIGLIQLLLEGIAYIQCRLCKEAPFFLIKVSSNLPVTFLLSGFCLFAMAYLLGRQAGRQIIIDNYPSWSAGSWAALTTFFIVTCVMVLVGSLEVDWQMNRPLGEFLKGVLTVLLILLFIGTLPAIGLGMIYGELLKRKKKNQT